MPTATAHDLPEYLRDNMEQDELVRRLKVLVPPRSVYDLIARRYGSWWPKVMPHIVGAASLSLGEYLDREVAKETAISLSMVLVTLATSLQKITSEQDLGALKVCRIATTRASAA